LENSASTPKRIIVKKGIEIKTKEK
jgi:hypothetical protein